VRVVRGGSAETASGKWFKFDVELDESDLQAIVIKHGIDSDELTVGNKFSILSKQAEVLVTIQMESQGLQGEQTAVEMMGALNSYLLQLPKMK
jgi:hypothetical protein